MDNKQIDWSKAPEWANGIGKVNSGRELWIGEDQYAYVGSEQKHFDWADDPSHMDLRHRSELVEIVQRPTAQETVLAPAIKTLEQRIIERAHGHLQKEVQEAMRHMRSVAKNRVDQPCGIAGMTVAEAIDAIGSAITKLREPDVAEYALESSLDRLAEQMDPQRLFGRG